MKRTGCTCENVEAGRYDHVEVVPIPAHMAEYRRRRVAKGLSPDLGIDRCIVDEVRSLWDRGIITYGSCCGHGKHRGYIQVDAADVPTMEALGYDVGPKRHGYEGRPDVFLPKSTEVRHG